MLSDSERNTLEQIANRDDLQSQEYAQRLLELIDNA